MLGCALTAIPFANIPITAASHVELKTVKIIDNVTLELTSDADYSFKKDELNISVSVDFGEFAGTDEWSVSGKTVTLDNELAVGSTVLIEGVGNVSSSAAATYGERKFPDEIAFDSPLVSYKGEKIQTDKAVLLNAAEASYQFTFIGSGFSLYGPTGDSMGMADIYVDGILADVADAYSEAPSDEVKLYTSETLETGLHTVTVMNNYKTNEALNKTSAPFGFTRASVATRRADEGEQLSLNGQWSIIKGSTSDAAPITADGYDFDGSEPILVPGNIWEAFPGYIGSVWYGREFDGFLETKENERVYLRFEAVQYKCDVYLNGTKLGSHTGSEIPFEFDVTDVIKQGRKNFLSVCVTNGKGMLSVFANTETAGFWDCGGIWQEVSLNVRPKAYISDVYAVSDWKTGAVRLDFTVCNTTENSVPITLNADIADMSTGEIKCGQSGKAFTAASGENKFSLDLKVEDFKLWDTENPNLYTVKASLGSEFGSYGYKSFNFGFRNIEIKNGFYYLNGKRFYLKMTHENIYDPLIIQGTPRNAEYLLKKLDNVKSSGFNTFRFIGTAGIPAQLDYADRIGLLIYEESAQSWMGKNAWVDENYDKLVIRDRNHPSIIIWGLLNETGSAGDNRLAITRAYLPRLRKVDETRIVFWSSGGWDNDSTLAHVSNSYSSEWDVYLGGEDPDKPQGGHLLDHWRTPDAGWVGDLHYYPTYPMSQSILEHFKSSGLDANPFIISEAGASGLYNPYNELKKALAAGAAPDSFSLKNWVYPLIEKMDEAFGKYSKLSKQYASPEDIVHESEAAALTQREMMLTYIRANGNMNGHSLTSLSDCSGMAEGITDNFGDFKNGYKETLRDAWGDLRWCILLNNENSNVRVGESINFQIYLSTIDVLPAGTHTASISIKNKAGEEVYNSGNVSFTVESGGNAAFAYKVWENNMKMNFPEGEYTVTATLNSDKYTPTCGTDTFYITDNGNIVDSDSKTVTVAGTLSQQAMKALSSNGVTVREFDAEAEIDNEVILVGKLDGNNYFWKSLFKKVAKGAYAAILDASALGTTYEYFPDIEKPYIVQTGTLGALYHNEWVLLDDDVLSKGLKTGVMDTKYFGISFAYGDRKIMNMPTPDIANMFSVYMEGVPHGGYTAEGAAMGTYKHHNGMFTLSNINLSDAANAPAIERLLLNLVNYGHDNAGTVTAIDEEKYEQELIGYGYSSDSDGDAELVNGDFEEENNSGEIKGFTFELGSSVGGTASVSADTTGAREGQMLSLYSGTGYNGELHTFKIYKTVEVTPNTNYSWELYVLPTSENNHMFGVVAGNTVSDNGNTTLPMEFTVLEGSFDGLRDNYIPAGACRKPEGTADPNWKMFTTTSGWKKIRISFNSGDNTAVSLTYVARAANRRILMDDWLLYETDTEKTVMSEDFENMGEVPGFVFDKGCCTNGKATIGADFTGNRPGNVITLETGNGYYGTINTYRLYQSVSVKPNTDYIWEFYVLPTAGANQYIGVVAGNKVGTSGNTTLPISVKTILGTLTFTDNTFGGGAISDVNGAADKNWKSFGLEGSGWRKVRVEFNSGYNESVSLAYVARASGRSVMFDDWAIYEAPDIGETVNGSFEKGLTGYAIDSAVAEPDTETVHSGKTAIKVGAPSGVFNRSYLYQTVKVKPNTDYMWSMWFKCDPSAAANKFLIGVMTMDKTQLLPSSITTNGGYLYPDEANRVQERLRDTEPANWHQGLTTGDWREYKVAFNSGDCTEVNLTLNMFYENRKGWTDDWTLSPLTEIKNGDFELTRPTVGYTLQNVTAEAEKENVHSGGQSLKISFSGVTDTGLMSQTINVKPDSDYSWSFWYKSETPEKNLLVGVTGEDSKLLPSFIKTDGAVLSGTESFLTSREGALNSEWHASLTDSGWTKYTVVFNSGDNQTVDLTFKIRTAGVTGYTDDWSVERWSPLAGDADNNGSLDACDVAAVKKFLLDGKQQFYKSGIDANSDGKTDILDFVNIKNRLAEFGGK